MLYRQERGNIEFSADQIIETQSFKVQFIFIFSNKRLSPTEKNPTRHENQRQRKKYLILTFIIQRDRGYLLCSSIIQSLLKSCLSFGVVLPSSNFTLISHNFHQLLNIPIYSAKYFFDSVCHLFCNTHAVVPVHSLVNQAPPEETRLSSVKLQCVATWSFMFWH